ncbi:MAG: hypothetical protein IPF54_05525 [Draconibacterium sp.]|nr:hypothetical protein [Draconibacterium sp.]
MKKPFLLWLLVSSIFTVAFGQKESEDFKPHGKPLALIFTNFNTAFTDGETHPNFEITRAYLGYEYNLSKEFYAKIILDVGDPKVGGLQMTAYLKNAYVEYSKNNLTASFGMISTTQFKVSEKIWGLRYIEKSFQDAYKFNSSADLGFNIDYQFADFISADFSVFNGEGYKLLQNDDYVRPGVGITVNPVKKITARLFADTMGDTVKQQSLATFLAYKDKKLVLAAEYNYQTNYSMKDGQDIYGTSFYATYSPNNKILLFGRFDDLKSKALKGKSVPWQLSKDGRLIMAGIEFNPVKGVKVAPNFRYWSPADNTMPGTSYAYLNLELKF